jgi:hypothetical protein
VLPQDVWLMNAGALNIRKTEGNTFNPWVWHIIRVLLLLIYVPHSWPLVLEEIVSASSSSPSPPFFFFCCCSSSSSCRPYSIHLPSYAAVVANSCTTLNVHQQNLPALRFHLSAVFRIKEYIISSGKPFRSREDLRGPILVSTSGWESFLLRFPKFIWR